MWKMQSSRRLAVASNTAILCLSKRSCSLRHVMRVLPQPVIVVTSSMHHPRSGLVKRGVTCSSFTSLTMNPPTVLISIYNGNVINELIETSGHFAANLLSDRQVKTGMHFAKSLSTDLQYNQFENIKHSEGVKGLPLLVDSAGVLQCSVTKKDVLGDHHVWYGTVMEAVTNSEITSHPMLYYQRSFRTIGDELFMQAFEDTKLPFEEWTHQAHLRMAWNYISQYGQEVATPLIKQGIMKFNESNKDKVTTGYSETVTMFYIHVITKAVDSMPSDHTFDEFLVANEKIANKEYLLKHYSPDVLASSLSKETFLKPDRLSLP